ncbi:hypothetical protein Scep_000998 [Stephania cephalantha]|uniref:Uncharacterized protein n=1 Tax=Stephania cephalantha TaxID=152367 RepID=A0AAP0L742_9MAGN
MDRIQDGFVLRKFLKVWVEIDINRPLIRRKKINSGFKPMFIEFKYERIKLIICHICGKITRLKHLYDQDHPAGQAYPYGDWMLVEHLPKQPPLQRGESSRRRYSFRGPSSDDKDKKSMAQINSDSDKFSADKSRSMVDMVGASNNSPSPVTFSGSSSNQLSDDAGAKNALQVVMHISPEINADFYINIPMGLDLVRPYTITSRPGIINSGRLFADLLAHAQQMLTEPMLDITYPSMTVNNPNN